jgi:hypothetical protein
MACYMDDSEWINYVVRITSNPRRNGKDQDARYDDMHRMLTWVLGKFENGFDLLDGFTRNNFVHFAKYRGPKLQMMIFHNLTFTSDYVPLRHDYDGHLKEDYVVRYHAFFHLNEEALLMVYDKYLEVKKTRPTHV